MKALTFLARRFVAGETADGAIAAGRRLQKKGIKATFDLLGEDVHDQDSARRSTEAIKALVQALPPDVESNVSIKLSMTGLGISEQFCLEQASEIVRAARDKGGFIRVDMEGSKLTQKTLDVYRRLRKEFDNVGIVLQAYLHRTQDDVKECIRQGDRVRLCKGAYREPPEVAIQRMDDIRANFRACAQLLLDSGKYPAVATHDEGLVQAAIAYAREKQIPASRFEFQMLYGLRPKRWEELVRDGYNVRIYVPYGTHWIPYFYRRLRERKENIFFVLKGILGG